MPQPTPARVLSDNARSVLHRLPTADAVTVMEDMLSKVAGVNNNNIAKPGELTREEMVKKVNELPDENLKAILRAHGIIG